MAYIVKFSKIQNNHDRLRSDIILGECLTLPCIGKPFTLISEPLNGAVDSVRVVTTNVVTKVEIDNFKIYKFTTASGSIYQIEKLDEESEDWDLIDKHALTRCRNNAALRSNSGQL